MQGSTENRRLKNPEAWVFADNFRGGPASCRDQDLAAAGRGVADQCSEQRRQPPLTGQRPADADACTVSDRWTPVPRGTVIEAARTLHCQVANHRRRRSTSSRHPTDKVASWCLTQYSCTPPHSVGMLQILYKMVHKTCHSILTVSLQIFTDL